MSMITATPSRRLPRLARLTWATWRQHRTAMAGVVALMAAAASLMVVTKLSMDDAYARLGLDSCGKLTGSACHTPLSLFKGQYQTWAQLMPAVLMVIPGLLGVFVGAPLIARELESGTFRFAWTQGRPRDRLILAKLILLGTALTALAVGFSILFSWWYSLWQPLMGRMNIGEAYEVSGVVFAARTLFALLLGAFVGAVTRRTVVAMGVTAVVWLGVVWSSAVYLRPHIMRPLVLSDSSPLIKADGWTVSSWVQDGAGHRFDMKSAQFVELFQKARRDGVTSSDAEFERWLASHHYSTWDAYQPGSHFWHFQVAEAFGYTATALLLAAATTWWVRRRAV